MEIGNIAMKKKALLTKWPCHHAAEPESLLNKTVRSLYGERMTVDGSLNFQDMLLREVLGKIL